MKSNDIINKISERELTEAIQSGDAGKLAEIFNARIAQIGEDLRAEYDEMVRKGDETVLANRGAMILTSEEKAFYEKFGEAVKASDPKQAISNIDVAMPKTVIDRVFEDLRTNHPLLSKINFIQSGGVARFFVNTNGFQKGAWGTLCAEIVKEIASGFKLVESNLKKLSAFLPMCKAMLELGPEWLDRYIREILYEAIANGMEDGIINGDGKDAPIGMIRQVGDSVAVVGGVYPEKVPVVIEDLSPATIGNLLAIVSEDEEGKSRNVDGIVMIVNPTTYFQRMMPALSILGPDGIYRNDVLPYPVEIIKSAAVAKDRAILGIARRYVALAGLPKEGRIEYSDEAHFLEDERIYIAKTYANGFPMDDNSFVYLNIENIKPYFMRVVNLSAPTASENANLSNLRIGSALSTAFAPGTTSYTASVTKASGVITAIAEDPAASVAIKLVNTTHPSSGVAVANGERVTWDTGTNTLTFTVTAEDGTTTKTYTVTVTKS